MSSAVGTSTGADMFLAVRSARAGDIKGEAAATDHSDEIVVHGWSWGMTQQVAAAAPTGGGGSARQAGQRRSLRPLTVYKRLDKATTSLMAVLGSNDSVRTAVLTMRKAGEGQQDFFKVTLTDGRVVDLDYAADEHGNVVEQVTFAFAKIEIEYKPQTPAGGRGGATTFAIDA
ncbi:MAG TPA: type VI secretion system tube protein Hcp [Burkholderiaceae bacterium]|nr:type VI secretion system tube protein Hcp [Burkholderiaceae bacterium]